MATLLTVKAIGDELQINWPPNHAKADKIKNWLSYLSPGYVEWLLRFGKDPHCSNCRDMGCDNIGNGDDACQGFKFSQNW